VRLRGVSIRAGHSVTHTHRPDLPSLEVTQHKLRALIVRAIDLLPGRSDEYMECMRFLAIQLGRILLRRKFKAEQCGIAQHVRKSSVEENRSR
jgi:hypothetical protein